MQKILITAFEPFGGESINPALVAVSQLPDSIDGCKILKLELPTVYGQSADILRKVLKKERPSAVISVGQAGGDACISIERVAVNLDDASAPDNNGVIREDSPIEPAGPAAYFATLPVKSIVAALRDAGIPAAVSDSAGTFVCNHVMYSALHYGASHDPQLLAGFVHIPFLPAQAADKRPGTASMAAETVLAGLEVIVRACLQAR